MSDQLITIVMTGLNGEPYNVTSIKRDNGDVYPLQIIAGFPITAVHSDTVTGTAEEVVPYSATRKALHVFNRTDGGETVDLGPDDTVTVGGGIPVAAGGSFTFNGAGASGPFYAITPAASTPISWAEG